MIRFELGKMSVIDAVATPHGWLIISRNNHTRPQLSLLTMTGEQKLLMSRVGLEITKSLVKGNWLQSVKITKHTSTSQRIWRQTQHKKDSIRRYEEYYLTSEGNIDKDPAKAWTFQKLEGIKIDIHTSQLNTFDKIKDTIGFNVRRQQTLSITKKETSEEININPIPNESLTKAYLSTFDHQTILVVADKTVVIIDNPLI